LNREKAEKILAAKKVASHPVIKEDEDDDHFFRRVTPGMTPS